ncbi:MAG: hypothetical protein HYZ36_06560, partial [Pedosphaera parvula]|nr:hypothetical protein [Pedosphaera parvula]
MSQREGFWPVVSKRAIHAGKKRRATRSRLRYLSPMNAPRHIHNVALIGFMGAGKSSVGHLVAAALQFKFVDTDELIEQRAGRSISEIFAAEGEQTFREYERQIIAELCQQRELVIATGGGLAANEANLASLKTHALVVCLWA